MFVKKLRNVGNPNKHIEEERVPSKKEYRCMEMFRQGDVLITRIARLPEGMNERQSKIILAGEGTRHAHRLLQGRVLEDERGALFLEVLQHTHVVHEEHNPLTLEPGYYQIIRQREYTPEAIRNVED
jgi:hypothetical protein